MKGRVIKKILSLLVVFTLILQQTGFAQGIGQLDISKYIGAFSGPQQFRPLLLRFFSYDPLTDDFQLLLDKGNLKKIEDSQLKEQGQELLKYFLVGVALPDENFWVNLRPDSEDQIINPELASTDLGKVLLEADLQLKKDVARLTSPETREGREYWNKLYAKAGQIFNSENITIPTLTRPWIVPGEVIIRENAQSAYVYKATLKVMLEQDHLKNSADYNFSDPRLKELNEYSSQLIREKIIPKLTKEVNSSRKYASLRQVFNSLILARWFKHKFAGKTGLYPKLINTGNLNGLASKEAWSKTTYFKEYQKSFASGEYNIKEQVNTVMGPTIRTYFSGGIAFQGELKMPTKGASSPLGTFLGNNPIVTRALLGNGMVAFAGTPASTQVVPNLESTVASPTGGVSPRIGFAASSPVISSSPASKEMDQLQSFRDIVNATSLNINFHLDGYGNNEFTTTIYNRFLSGFSLYLRGYEEHLVDAEGYSMGKFGDFKWLVTLSANSDRLEEALAAVGSAKIRLIPLKGNKGETLQGTLIYEDSHQLEGSLTSSANRLDTVITWSDQKLSGPYRIELILPESKKPSGSSSPVTTHNSVGGIDASTRSAAMPEAGVGGIDFRAIPMITQPMGNLSGLSFNLPKLSNLENINLDEEFSQIQKMLKAGITPSGARLKEFVAACYQKGELKQHLEGIVASIVDTCRLEEEKVDVTSNAVKEVMLILDSIG